MRAFLFLLSLVPLVSAQMKCNLCGCEACEIGNPTATVRFLYEEAGKEVSQNCQTLQQDVEKPVPPYSTSACRDYIWPISSMACGCFDPATGVFISDIPGFSLGSYGNNSAPLDWLNNPENPDFKGEVTGPNGSSDPGANGDPSDPTNPGNGDPSNPGNNGSSANGYLQASSWFLGTVLAWMSLSLVC